MGSMTKDEINASLFDEVKQLQAKVAELEANNERLRESEQEAMLKTSEVRTSLGYALKDNERLRAKVDALTAELKQIIAYYEAGGTQVVTCKRIAKQALKGEDERPGIDSPSYEHFIDGKRRGRKMLKGAELNVADIRRRRRRKLRRIIELLEKGSR